MTAFETGDERVAAPDRLAAGCASGCAVEPTPLYLPPGLKLSFDAPTAGDAAFDEYVSDPAKPVPFRARPIQPVGYDSGRPGRAGWSTISARRPAGRTSWRSSPTC